jgi:23S rRNA (cytosine1962-C5)-methyltransferase
MESKFDARAKKPADFGDSSAEQASVDHRTAYELLDFGEGRKLERFAGKLLDRPSPAARGFKRQRRNEWRSAEFVFGDRHDAGWSTGKSPDGWLFGWNSLVMELKLSPFGHVGLFPEQIANWKWLQRFAKAKPSERPMKALNLFGYTGGSTLAMAAAGFQVTHVDASRPTVQWARRNAVRSGMESAVIRWIVDDVRDFVRRATRRADRYDIILMDPPAYGHGADGQVWELARDLDNLVADCLGLLSPNPTVFLLTGHSPIESIESGPLTEQSWDRLRSHFQQLGKHRVSLADTNLRKLDFGYAYRFWNEGDTHQEGTESCD